jgi:hypothetical protein
MSPETQKKQKSSQIEEAATPDCGRWMIILSIIIGAAMLVVLPH